MSIDRTLERFLSGPRVSFLNVMSLCSLRPERPLLPVPGFSHLPQLEASEAAHVLVGPEPALCQERGRRDGA